MTNQLLIIIQYYQRSNQEQYTNLLFLIPFFGTILFVVGYFLYKSRFDKQWDNGVFPENLSFDRDNLMEAYICLAASMIKKDRRDSKFKVQFLNSYFIEHFPDCIYNFSESLRWSYEHPVQPKTVAFWINKHITDPSKKSQILYFLAGIALIDGQLIDQEHTVLKEIALVLTLEQKDLDAALSMHAFNNKKASSSKTRPEEKNESYKSKTASKVPLFSNRAEMAHKILMVPISATIQEIKASYRSLVKIHHPDRFANETNEQIQLAHERFCKIQDAYELLEKLKG